jgi:ParB family transcriptional regulator, chromosome partitioning protein
MSIKDRLAKKTADLLVPPTKQASPAAGAGPLKTGPGQMLMVNALMKETNQRVADLEERLKQFDGATAAKLLDPAQIVRSKWANRLEEGFDSPEFASLKEEIRSAGGNVQPIKVRPLADDNERYEIVFGHRRHRACLELGLPVLALISELSEQELFREMDRENRERLDLSPWEQGLMYRRALNEQLFSSLGELAAELGVDKGNISKALKLADLPKEVVAAFPSARDLQYRWAKLLNDALQSDPEGVLDRARELSSQTQSRPSSKEVLEILLGTEAIGARVDTVTVNGAVVAEIQSDGDRVKVKFARGAIKEEKLEKLREMLAELLRG